LLTRAGAAIVPATSSTIRVERAYAAQLDVTVPWSRLGSEPIDVKVTGIQIDLALKGDLQTAEDWGRDSGAAQRPEEERNDAEVDLEEDRARGTCTYFASMPAPSHVREPLLFAHVVWQATAMMPRMTAAVKMMGGIGWLHRR
jgi:hypothetical protein